MEAAAGEIALASGCVVRQPLDRLRRFLTEEYDYYDAIADGDPERIMPLDVIVTTAVNARVGRASQLRRIHRGIAEQANPLLPEIPAGADILTSSTSTSRR